MRLNLVFQLFVQLNKAEEPVCIALNMANGNKVVNLFFSVINSLANGKFWYAIMVAFPFIFGKEALIAVFQMIIVGLFCLPVYKYIKNKSRRYRPYITCDHIICTIKPLDKYSFPSGHTMNAVAFTIILCNFRPEFGAVLIPFTLLVALSRVVLGHHYPSDVISGAFVGTIIVASFNLIWF